MNKLFKPLSKRDATIASVIFGIGVIIFAVSLIKELLAGAAFEEIRTSILLVVFLGIIEYGMITIAFGKDSKKDGEDSGSSDQQEQ